MKINKQDIINLYKNSVKSNLDEIEKILIEEELYDYELLEKFNNALNQTSRVVYSRWKNNKKYVRTEFVLSAFKEEYPEKNLLASIMMDGMINILDDIHDEELDKSEKSMLLIEYLRVFALFIEEFKKIDLSDELSSYFNKLITLAYVEHEILSKLEQTQDENIFIDGVYNMLLSRSRDIDVFVQLAMINIKEEKRKRTILELFRVYRALNIFKKDIYDLEHDKKSSQKSVITISDSNGRNKLLLSTLRKFNDFLDEQNFSDVIANEILNMSYNEAGKIDELLKT